MKSERFTHTFCLEDILIEKSSSNTIRNDLTILLDAIHEPSLFNLYGVSYNNLNESTILSLLMKVFGKETNYNHEDYFMLLLINKLRKLLCNHTAKFIMYQNWDSVYHEILMNGVLKSHPIPCWKRVCKDIMVRDLNNTDNLDGMHGLLYKLRGYYDLLIDLISGGNVVALKELLIESRSLEPWISLSQVTYTLFSKWSLLHYAASITSCNIEIFKCLVSDFGCSILERDNKSRTPLHIAASCMNYEVILYLAHMNYAACRLYDSTGQLPLHCLLYTLSVSKWNKRISSKQLEEIILALISESRYEILWNCSYVFESNLSTCTEIENNTVYYQNQSISSMKSSLFYSCVVYTDDCIAQTIIKMIRFTSRSIWKKKIIEETIYECIKIGRYITVDVLIREFFDILELPISISDRNIDIAQNKEGLLKIDNQEDNDININNKSNNNSNNSNNNFSNDICILDFLDTCLCYCVTAKILQIKILGLLLEHYSRIWKNLSSIDTSKKTTATTALDDDSRINDLNNNNKNRKLSIKIINYSLFIYLAIMKEDGHIISCIINYIPKSLLRALIYPLEFKFKEENATTMIIKESQQLVNEIKFKFSLNFQLRVLRFCSIFTLLTNIKCIENFMNMSPISVICMLGNEKILQIILRSSYQDRLNLTTNNNNNKNIANHSCEYHYIYPLLYSIYYGSSSCFKILKNLLGDQCFINFCYKIQVIYNCNLFMIYINLIRDYMILPHFISIKTKRTPYQHNHNTNITTSKVVNYNEYVEILTLFLEPLQRCNDVFKKTFINMNDHKMNNLAIIKDSSLICSKYSILNIRMNNIKASIQQIHLEILQDTSLTNTNDIITSMIDDSTCATLYQSCMKQWKHQLNQWNKILQSMSTKHFQISLKLICKRYFKPDKTWLKLCYCFNYIYDILYKKKVTTTTTTTEDYSMLMIDMKTWNRFISIIQQSIQSDTSYQQFLELLISSSTSAKNIFSNILNDQNLESIDNKSFTKNEYFHIKNITKYEWNQINSIFYSENLTNVTILLDNKSKTNKYLNKPHIRIHTIYQVFYDWVERILSDIKLHHDLSNQSFSLRPKQQNSQSVHIDKNISYTISVNKYQHYQYLLQYYHLLETITSNMMIDSEVNSNDVLGLLFNKSNFNSYQYDEFCLEALEFNKFIDMLQYNGISNIYKSCNSSSSVKYEIENWKKSKTFILEKILIIFIEMYPLLNSSTSYLSLINFILPLSCLQMWNVLKALLNKVMIDINQIPTSKKDSLINLLNQMNFIMIISLKLAVNIHQMHTPYEDYIYEELHYLKEEKVLKQQSYNELYCLTPLHFFVKHNQKNLLITFLKLFPKFSFNMEALVIYAQELNAYDMIKVLVTNSENSINPIAKNSIHPLIVDSNRFDTKRERKDACNLFISSNVHQQCNNIYQVLQTVQNKINITYDNENRLNYFYISPFVFTWFHSTYEKSPTATGTTMVATDITSTGTTKLCVVLMDGTFVPWEQLMSDASLIARALPSAIEVKGIASTGNTLLHHAMCMTDTLDLAYLLLNDQSNNKQHYSHYNSMFTVDSTGYTPIYHAIKNQHYDVVIETLNQCLEDSPNSSSLLPINHNQLSHLLMNHTISNCIHQIDSNQILQPILNEIKQLAIPNIQNTSLGNTKFSKSLLFKDCKSSLDILSIYLQYTELYWNKLLQCNSKLLIQVCQFNGFGELDSIKRARQILGLLGIPLSQLSLHDKELQNKTNYSRNLKDFNHLTPSKIKKLLSWMTCQQIRNILCGWYRTRSTNKPSYIEDSILLLHRTDISITELGQSGRDISSYSYDKRDFTMKQNSNDMNQLCEQLKLEFISDKISNGYENIIPSNESIRYSNINSATTIMDKVTYFLKSQEMNINTCKEILNISYIILDFARLLCISRYYTSITQEMFIISDYKASLIPTYNYDSIGTIQHPLDSKLQKYKQLNEEKQRINLLLPTTFHSKQPQQLCHQSQNNVMIAKVKDNEQQSIDEQQGMKTRIKICDFITIENLHAFYLIDSKISDRFNNLRSFITEGLSSILLDLGLYQLSEFLCRVLINPMMNYSNDHSSNNNNNNNSNSYQHQVLRSKFSKITNSEYGLNQLLLFIQKISIEDIVKSNSKYENIDCFQTTHIDAIKLLTYDYHPNKDYYRRVMNITQQQFSVDQNEFDTINKLIDMNVSLRECKYESNYKDKELVDSGDNKILSSLVPALTITKHNMNKEYTRKANLDMINILKHGYETAKTLFHFIQSVIGLHKNNCYDKIYKQDLHENLSKYKNMLAPLCYNNIDKVNNIICKSKSTQTTRKKICNLLLKLGANPLYDNSNNSIDSSLYIDNPIIIASIEGQSQLLELMLLKCNSIYIENDENLYQNNSKYLYLLWHVIMNYRVSISNHSDYNYLECIELLINHKFSLQHPSYSIDGRSMSTISILELITFYQIEIKDHLFELVINQEDNIESIFRSLHYSLLSNTISQKKIQFLINRIQGNDTILSLTTKLSINHYLFHDNYIIANISIHLEYLKKLYVNDNHRSSNIYNNNNNNNNNIKEKIFESICNNFRKQIQLYLYKMKSIVFINNDLQTILDNLQQYEKTIINASVIDNNFDCNQLMQFKYTTSYHILELVISTSNDGIVELICKLILPTFQNVMSLDQNITPYLTIEFSNIEHILQIACLYNISSVFYIFAALYDNTNIGSKKNISIRRWFDILETSYMVSLPHMLATSYKNMKKPMNILQLALLFGSDHVIKYLLTVKNISISPSSVMEAIIKGKLNELIILDILQAYINKENIKTYEEIKDIFVITIKHNDTMNNTIIESIETLLHISCRRGYSLIVTKLLEIGANPEETEKNPWYIPNEIEHESDQMIDIIKTTNNVILLKELTALQCSIISGHGNVTKILYKACNNNIKHAIELMIYTIRRYLLNKYRNQSLNNIENRKNKSYISNNDDINFKF